MPALHPVIADGQPFQRLTADSALPQVATKRGGHCAVDIGGVTLAPMNDHHPLEARGLTKRYGTLTAVNGIDFDVQASQCVGFLGPNGAGKTTTVKMVAGFSPITAGSALVFGIDVSQHPRDVKRQIGVCPQEDNLDPDFSVWKNLMVFARYFAMPRFLAQRRAHELLQFLHLTEKMTARIDELSGGMKRRLLLARALLNSPGLLLLDEPTTGLDPQARHLIWQRVRQLRDGGTTVLLTTHYMEEASQLCDRVILMDEGTILLEGKPEELVAREVGREVVELWKAPPEVAGFVRDSGWTFEHVEDRIIIRDQTGGDVSRVIEDRFPGQDRLIRGATLEDVFLIRTGRALKE
jgi:lipooligosaccharide transport system ATP-binding protein